jgi:hypothetical protein
MKFLKAQIVTTDLSRNPLIAPHAFNRYTLCNRYTVYLSQSGSPAQTEPVRSIPIFREVAAVQPIRLQ